MKFYNLQRESRCCSNSPFRDRGRGRVRMVTSGLNVPRHGIATALRATILRVSPGQGCLPKSQAVVYNEWCSFVSCGRTDIARRVRLREKPTHWDTRRPRTLWGKADGCREAKGTRTCTGPGVRPVACEDSQRNVVPEIPAFPQGRSGFFFTTLRRRSAGYKSGDTDKRRSWAFGKSEWPGSDDG